jgi:hypothetical protein
MADDAPGTVADEIPLLKTWHEMPYAVEAQTALSSEQECNVQSTQTAATAIYLQRGNERSRGPI